MKVVKRQCLVYSTAVRFESIVNYESSKTRAASEDSTPQFESIVNYESSKTACPLHDVVCVFESIVNCKACVVMQVKVLTWYVFERSVNDKVF